MCARDLQAGLCGFGCKKHIHHSRREKFAGDLPRKRMLRVELEMRSKRKFIHSCIYIAQGLSANLSDKTWGLISPVSNTLMFSCLEYVINVF